MFVFLYPFVFVIGMMGIGVQIHKLITDKESALSMPVLTWAMWTFAWMISFGYGMTKIHDLMYCLTAGLNCAAHGCVLIFILYRRYEAMSSIHTYDKVTSV